MRERRFQITRSVIVVTGFVLFASSVASAQQWSCTDGYHDCVDNGYMPEKVCAVAAAHCKKSGHWYGLKQVNGEWVDQLDRDHGLRRKE